jgi:hypothetical protein
MQENITAKLAIRDATDLLDTIIANAKSAAPYAEDWDWKMVEAFAKDIAAGAAKLQFCAHNRIGSRETPIWM